MMVIKKNIAHLFKLFLTFACVLFFSENVFATHNRAGEITYHHVSGYEYEVTITTYTKISAPADRPDLEIFWGDGQSDTILRTNGSGTTIAPDIRKNEYLHSHTYQGPGNYIISVVDQNRNAGVLNMSNSVNVPFYVQSLLTILPVSAPNNSPVLSVAPIDNGAVGQLFIHNPGAIDPDGDSLSYELIKCLTYLNNTVQICPGYVYPDPASTFATNSFSIDTYTGDIIWDSPTTVGEFNIAMKIIEWRRIPGFVGVFNVGYVIRDLQVTIIPSSNHAPVIANVNDTCVEAGSPLAYIITATDQDNDEITLTATGGPLDITQSPAQFSSTPATSLVTGNFTWNTTCAHVRRNPYSVVFKATDNNPVVHLVDIENLFITVVGPSPKNPLAVANANGINLSWNESACTNAVGYKIYRHTGYFGFIPSLCEVGVPSYTGYSLIKTIGGVTDTSFYDDNNGQGLANGVTYCYMITAIYPDGVESYASLEVCTSLSLDLPVITNVDVLTTDNTNGKIAIAWSSPKDLDTVQWKGPYRYTLERAIAPSTNFTDVISFTDLNDTTYTDSILNTADNQYRYKVQLFNETNSTHTLIGTTQIANSIFLTVTPGDNHLFLSWNENVPWSDTLYVVYKQNTAGIFDSIAVTEDRMFNDTAVVNGTTYCYFIKSIGTYAVAGLISPIINNSEIECSTPFDNEPPCVPSSFAAKIDCSLSVDSIVWSFAATPDSCKIEDIKSFSIYFIPTGTTDTTLIGTVTDSQQHYFIITDTKKLAGCYFITVTDTNNNTSSASAVSCTEGCPRYTLPNFFSPDQNGINDQYHPIAYNYSDVKDIDIKIYNRWGDVVFATTDPDINWNGKRKDTGEEVPDGVYYYICTVNELFLDGVKPRVLTGFITLLRGSNGVAK